MNHRIFYLVQRHENVWRAVGSEIDDDAMNEIQCRYDLASYY